MKGVIENEWMDGVWMSLPASQTQSIDLIVKLTDE